LALVGAEQKNSVHFSDFNLYGPATNSSKRFNAGYTTDSGVIKPHLLSFYSFVFNSAADLPALISTDQVKVIPVCEAIDGIALKPGRECLPATQFQNQKGSKVNL